MYSRVSNKRVGWNERAGGENLPFFAIFISKKLPRRSPGHFLLVTLFDNDQVKHVSVKQLRMNSKR